MNILELPEDLLTKIYSIVKREEEKEIDFMELDENALPIIEANLPNACEEIGEFIYDRLYKRCYSDEEINEYVKTRSIEKYYKKWWRGQPKSFYEINIQNFLF